MNNLKLPTTHKVTAGDTVSGIALKYYGSAVNKDLWVAIAEANPGRIDPKTFLIRSGDTIVIPALIASEKNENLMNNQTGLVNDSNKNSGSTAPRLSKDVPEPTSYTGKYFVEIPFMPEKDYFLLDDLSLAQNDEVDYALKFPLTSEKNAKDYVNLPSHPKLAIKDSLTISAWIKKDGTAGFIPIVISIGDSSSATITIYLTNGKLRMEAVTKGQSNTYLSNSEILYGRWQHIAMAVHNEIVTFYLNGNENGVFNMNEKEAAFWKEVCKNLGDTCPAKIGEHVNGLIDQVQIWDRALSPDEIKKYKNSAPSGNEDGLVGCWLMNEGSGTMVSDISQNELHGKINGGVQWVLSDRLFITTLSDKVIEGAYKDALEKSVLHSSLFPNSEEFNGREDIKSLMKEVTLETFKKEYQAGRKMRILYGVNGALTWVFAREPSEIKPKLFLVETYRLSSFLGAYGVGRTIRTFSLLPGEKTKISISSYKKTDQTNQSTSSIFDSVNDKTAATFTDDLLTEKSGTSKEDENSSWHAEGSVEASWGWGSAKVSAGGSGSSNSSRESFAKGVSNVINNHASETSSKRDVQVNTSSETTTSTGGETSIQRDIENINVSRTLNFIFRQMNQEYITLLHLVDVKVGFSMAGRQSRRVFLSELDDLLGEVIIEGKRDEVRKIIIGELQNIHNYQDNSVNSFIQKVDLSDEKKQVILSYHRINKSFASTYVDPSTETEIEVPGIIINVDKVVMRTDDVLVDAVLGDGDALDEYSQGLQTQAVEAERVQNEFLALKNQLLRKIVDAPDKQTASAAAENYQKVFGEASTK